MLWLFSCYIQHFLGLHPIYGIPVFLFNSVCTRHSTRYTIGFDLQRMLIVEGGEPLQCIWRWKIITDGWLIFEFPIQFTRCDEQPDNSFFHNWRKEPLNSDFHSICIHVLSTTPMNALKKCILHIYTWHVVFFMLFSISGVFYHWWVYTEWHLHTSVMAVCKNLIPWTEIWWLQSDS